MSAFAALTMAHGRFLLISVIGRSNVRRLPTLPKELLRALQDRQSHSEWTLMQLSVDVDEPCLCHWADCDECNPMGIGAVVKGGVEEAMHQWMDRSVRRGLPGR